MTLCRSRIAYAGLAVQMLFKKGFCLALIDSTASRQTKFHSWQAHYGKGFVCVHNVTRVCRDGMVCVTEGGRALKVVQSIVSSLTSFRKRRLQVKSLCELDSTPLWNSSQSTRRGTDDIVLRGNLTVHGCGARRYKPFPSFMRFAWRRTRSSSMAT